MEEFLIHLAGVIVDQVERPGILVTGEHGAMVLAHEILDARRQAVLTGQADPIGDVTDDSLGTIGWHQVIVRVEVVPGLVLDKESRVERFPGVVI